MSPFPDPIPRLLADYAAVAYREREQATAAFPDLRTYRGSAAQVFHVLREARKRIRLTLFEIEPQPAEALRRYFADQGAKAVLLRVPDRNRGWAKAFLRHWWDAAVQAAKDDPDDPVVMVVQGDSWKLAPALWSHKPPVQPGLVFVDPFKLDDPDGEPARLLSTLSGAQVPFMCWTPLLAVPKNSGNKWNPGRWSFESNQGRVGDRKAARFVNACRSREWQMVWCCWEGAAGARQHVYGCQLTFGSVLANGVDVSDIWRFDGAAPDEARGSLQPGSRWWDKYHLEIGGQKIEGQGDQPR